MKTKIKILKDIYGYKAGDVLESTLYSLGSHVASDIGYRLPNRQVVWVPSSGASEESALRYGYNAISI